MLKIKDPLPEPVVKEIVDTWVDVSKIPLVYSGYIREDNNFLNLVTQWGAEDAAKKEGLVFSRTFSVLKSSLESGANPIVSSAGSAGVAELAVLSKSGQRKAVYTRDALGSEFFQIWSESTLLKSYNLTQLNMHRSVYASGGWGVTMAWSANETKFAYLAERKAPVSKSYYSSASATKCRKKVAELAEAEYGQEYVYQQTWGENLVGHYFSVIMVVDVNTDEFKLLPLSEEYFPTDIQWIGDSHICGTSYLIPVWRYGLSACSNRESIIFTIQADGENFTPVTALRKASRSPRVRPDGNYLVWQERILDGAHERARSIYGIALSAGLPSGQPQLIYRSDPEDGMPIYLDFPPTLWSTDGTVLYPITFNEAQIIGLAITVEGGTPGAVKKLENVGGVLAITKDYLLVISSTILSTPRLSLLDISQDYKVIAITESSNVVDFETMTQLVNGEVSPTSMYFGPAVESVPANSVSLVVYVHGGPHASFLNTYIPELAFFLRLGYGVLGVNYVGSTGGVRDTADDLMGSVGDKDVKDCQAILQKLLTSNTSINPDKIALWGSSHGGFLSCHLTSQYPDTYKAAVISGPVTDWATMVATSDVADFVYAETGLTLPADPTQTLIPTARDLEDAEKYIKASPIHLAGNVQAACLLMMGSQDLRVPSQQGLSFYRALLANNKTADVRMYPDGHSFLTGPVRLDSTINAGLWFKKFLD